MLLVTVESDDSREIVRLRRNIRWMWALFLSFALVSWSRIYVLEARADARDSRDRSLDDLKAEFDALRTRVLDYQKGPR